MSTHTLNAPRSAQTERFDSDIIENRAATVGQLFRDRVARSPQGEAFRFAAGDTWESVTWSEVRENAYRLAAGLIALGVSPEDRVAIASSTD